MQRRDWLVWSGMLGAASLIPQRLLADEIAEGAAVEQEQVSRPAHKMKLSLAAYSFNRMLPRNWPTPRKGDATMSLLDFIDYCAGLNLDACELTSYYFPAEITDEYVAAVKSRTFRQGLDISGTAIGNDFCFPEGEARDEQLQLTRQWIDYAAAMGAPVIRIFAGKQKKDQTFEQAVSQCASGINEAVAYAATKGVCLALENHGGITATPEQMLQIIEQVDESPFFGVNFDSGNFRTDDPYRDLAKIAPLAINAQIKTEVQVAGQRQPADMKRIVDMLKEANYRGYIVLEYEEREPLLEIPRYVDQLRELIA